MAAELLRHQNSVAYYQSKHSGCMWGWLHLVDLHKHQNRGKMLTYKQSKGKHGGGTRTLTSEQSFASSDEQPLLDKQANSQMENKVNTTKKSSGRAHLITLLYKKITRKCNRKLKTSSSSTQLFRTFSIHHLECDDYPLPDEMGAHGRILSSTSGKVEESLQEIKVDNSWMVFNRLKDLKQRIKMALKENKKEHRRIAMDAVLDKIPSGRKDEESEKRSCSPRKRSFSEGAVPFSAKIADRSMQRSRSLTENLDRYSHLLKSISVREPQRPLEGLSLIKKDGGDFDRRRILRSQSLRESFDRHSHLLESIPVPKRQPERLKSIREDDLLLDRSPLKTFGRILSNPEVMSFSFSNNIQNEQLEVNMDSSNEPKSVDIIEENTETNTSELVDEHDQSGERVASDDLIADDSSIDHHIDDDCEIKEDRAGEPTETSPVSVLDSYFEEYPVTAANCMVMQDLERDSGMDSKKSFVTGDYKLIEADCEEEATIADSAGICSSHYKEDAEFNYVREILQKSGFDGGAEDFLAAWYSSYEPIDQLVCLEEGSPDELEALENQHLLIDLVNEVLLKIYDVTIACSTGISRFCPQIGPMLIGDNHVLDEVWAKVSSYRGLQDHRLRALDDVIARDFARNDGGWMNLQQDVVEVGVEVEEWILEDLVDEMVLELVGVV